VSTKITSNISTALLSSIAIASYFLNCSFSNRFLLAWAASTRSVFEVLREELDQAGVRLKASLAGSAIDSVNCTG